MNPPILCISEGTFRIASKRSICRNGQEGALKVSTFSFVVTKTPWVRPQFKA